MLRCSPALMPNLLVFTSAIILAVVQTLSFECGGKSFPFGIVPQADQYIKYDHSMDFYCILDMSHEDAAGHTSSDLSFFTTKKDGRIPMNFTIMNETTIVTSFKGISLGRHFVYCSLKESKDEKEKNNCLTSVEVGFEPQEVKNFSCVSWNWQGLECKWFPPESYISTTQYKLKISFANTKTKKRKTYLPCPEDLNATKNFCKLTFDTDPIYRQPIQFYSFQLIGTNPLGNYTTNIELDHFAHVIPKKPESISLVNKTIGSAVLNWSIAYPMNFFPTGLRTKIEYRSKWDPPNKWNEIMIDETVKIRDEKTRLYNLTGLMYAHALYDVKIYHQSGAASRDYYWSQPGLFSFITPSTIPGRAPNTTFGSFHITFRGSESDVYIYWAKIPEYMENGEDFDYNVTCVMNMKYDCDHPIEKTLSYAKYAINNNYEYLFTVYSVNSMGRSIDSSRVFVPKMGSVPRPESHTNVPYSNGVHELSWKAVDHKNLANYTIFWCEDDQSIPLPCKGNINWIHVSKNITQKNVTVNSIKKFYKFAIAANLIDGSSSGMVWFSCIVLHDKVDKAVSEVIIGNVGSREADIVWQIECAQSYNGYYLYYCPVLGTQNNDCQKNYPEKSFLVKEVGKRNVTLTNLKPYTTYRLQISVMSNNGTHEKIGPRSKSHRFTTLEDAPSEPLNLRKLSVKNSSVVLAWDVPLETNGILQKYKLDIKSVSSHEERTKSVSFEAKDAGNILVTQYKVENLSAYTAYKFTLRACTSDVKCSKPSTDIIVTTRVGKPGRMSWPRIVNNSNTMAILDWEKPSIAAGNVDYYELNITVNGTYHRVMKISGTRAEVPLSDCNTTFSIRAVNVDNNVIHPGEWSKDVSSRCAATAWTKSMALFAWIACICMFLVISAALFYIVKRGWLHCSKMKDVEVKLPPGLQSQDLEKDNQDYLHLDRWPPRPSDTIQGSLDMDLAPDEESLLGKKSDECLDPITQFNIGVKNGEGSSGCSVGRESMSSSVSSENHTSSDSGAEADQNVNAEDLRFGKRSNSKLQCNDTLMDSKKIREDGRKGSHPEETLNFSSVTDWTAGDPAAPGYTRVGFTEGSTGDKSLPGKGYVAIASITPQSPPENSSSKTSYDSYDNFPLLFDQEPKPPESGTKNFPGSQIKDPSSYVTLACLQEIGLNDPVLPGIVLSGSRSTMTESGKLHVLDEMPASLTMCNSSLNGNEEIASETRNSHSMPPYVSIVDNSGEVGDSEENKDVEEYEVEEKDNEKKEDVRHEGIEKKLEQDVRLSNDIDLSNIKTVNGIDSVVGKFGNGTESYSNYIPHHIFGK